MSWTIYFERMAGDNLLQEECDAMCLMQLHHYQSGNHQLLEYNSKS